jgi:hypothetical protein
LISWESNYEEYTQMIIWSSNKNGLKKDHAKKHSQTNIVKNYSYGIMEHRIKIGKKGGSS